MKEFSMISNISIDNLNNKQELEDYNDNVPKNLTYNVLKERLLIKFKKDLNDNERAMIGNGL